MTVCCTFADRCCRQARALNTHILHTGLHELHAHVNGEDYGYEANETCREEVKNTNVFVVCGHKPPSEKARPFVIMSRDGSIGHVDLLFRLS